MENNLNLEPQNNINTSENVGKRIEPVDRFEISDSAFACVMFIVLSFAFSLFLQISGITCSATSFVYYLLNALGESVFALAAVLVAVKRKANIKIATGLDKKINWNIVGWCFLLALVSLLGFSNITNVFIEILSKFGYRSVSGDIIINTFWQYLGWIFASCFAAAFCEEILFRGVIESGFRKWGIKVAVGCSALIFMIMHGSATQTIHQLIVGIIVGYIFYKTNNLLLGFLVHFFNNFIPITEVFLLSIASTETASETVSTTSIGWGTIIVDLIVAVVVAMAGLYFVKEIIKRILKENEKLNGKFEENQTNDNLSAIKIDGNEEQVEITIGETATAEKNKKPELSKSTALMFAISGVILVFEWIVGTIAGFL